MSSSLLSKKAKSMQGAEALKQGVAGCIGVLEAIEPVAKINAAQEAVRIIEAITPPSKGPAAPDRIPASTHILPTPPLRPGRPRRPLLVHPTKLPRRRLGSVEGRAALMHAIAHIEFNAIDLAFDMAARFLPQIMALDLDGWQFLQDWVAIGGEEALHFGLVTDRLAQMGVEYGDLPAHDGLWEAAENTNDEVLARLAIAPMVLEARGLDVTPAMIASLAKNDDHESAAILQRIYDDEIGHVAAGSRWFKQVCGATKNQPAQTFQDFVKTRFHGGLKEPFNHAARKKAGIELAFYQSWMVDFSSDESN